MENNKAESYDTPRDLRKSLTVRPMAFEHSTI